MTNAKYGSQSTRSSKTDSMLHCGFSVDFSGCETSVRAVALAFIIMFLSAQIQVLIGKTEKRGETFKSSITHAEPLAQMGGEMAQLVVDLQLADNVKEIVSINIMRDYQYHY